MVELGIEIEIVNMIEMIGIRINISIGKIKILIIKIFNIIQNTPIKKPVTKDKANVANVFSNNDFLLNSPIMKSLEVLAIKGPLRFPLRDNKAGTIIIKKRKLLKGNINIKSIIPAKISPMMEIISEVNVSLMILLFPLDSFCSIF